VRCLHGGAIVVALAAVAPAAWGRAVTARLKAGRPGRESPSTSLVRRKGRSIARSEGATGHDDWRALEGVDQAVRVADLVIEATAGRRTLPSSRVDFADGIVLKGSLDGNGFAVDFQRAPASRWPSKGERRILCLVKKADSHYELASYHACVLPATRSVRSVVMKWVRRCPPPQAPDPLAEATAASEAVFVGTLTNVIESGDPSRTGQVGSIGTFSAEDVLLGHAGLRGPFLVSFTTPLSGRDGRRRNSRPRAGRYLLFARSGTKGEALAVVDAVHLIDTRAREEATRRARAALGSRKGRLTTIQATVAEYEGSWNDRDIDRVIKCYSRGSPVREQYVSNRDARQLLRRQLEMFSGQIGLSLMRTRTPGTRRTGQAPGTATADAKVAVTIRPTGGLGDRLVVTMGLVHEDGEWLIARDGF